MNNARMPKATETTYVRLEEAMKIFKMGRKKVRKLAVDAEALYKVEKLLLIDINKMDQYIQTFFKEV